MNHSDRKAAMNLDPAAQERRLDRAAQAVSSLRYEAADRIKKTREELPVRGAETLLALAGLENAGARQAILRAKNLLESADKEDAGNDVRKEARAALSACARIGLPDVAPRRDLPLKKDLLLLPSRAQGFHAAKEALEALEAWCLLAETARAYDALGPVGRVGNAVRLVRKAFANIGIVTDEIRLAGARLSQEEADEAADRLRCEAAYAKAVLLASTCPDGEEAGDAFELENRAKAAERVRDILKVIVVPDTSESVRTWKRTRTMGGKFVLPETGSNLTATIVDLKRRRSTTGQYAA